jgi:hypothetical protein
MLVDAGELPLHLPLPNGLNNGGYVVPDCKGQTVDSYSPIDVLVAGLEAIRLCKVVTNLAQFFDQNRLMFSDMKVSLTTDDDSAGVEHLSIWEIKTRILVYNNYEWLKVMQRNAPLTFKWVKL